MPAKLILGAAALVLTLAIFACSEEGTVRVVQAGRKLNVLAVQRWSTDAFKEIPLPDLGFADAGLPDGGPKRVVCVVPSFTELIFTLGMGERLVGRSHWCDWPPEARDLPDVGRLMAMSKEAIVDLKPDLVVTTQTQVDLVRSLREDFQLKVISPPSEAGAEIFAGMQMVADALGVPERGKALEAHLRREMKSVTLRWASASKPRVLVVLDRSSWWVPGRTSFVHEMLEAAGGQNVSAILDTDKPWPMVTFEKIIDWRPDVILDLSVGTNAERSRSEAADFWERHAYIPAVAEGRVILIQAGVLVRAGPRMAAAAASLAEIIHGSF
jgi:iron complex transport system substrate-binding protein